MYCMNLNVNLMKQNVIQIIGRIMINVDVNVKGIIYVMKLLLETLVHVFEKTEYIYQVLWIIQWLRVMKL